MSLRSILVVLVLSAALGACGQRSPAPRVGLQLVADDFTSPVALVAPHDGTERLFVADQTGLVWVLVNGQRLAQPLLDLRKRVVELHDFYDERGLLGLTLHPDFASNGRFYVSYSAPLRAGLSPDQWDHTTYISEFKVSSANPNQADRASERVILALDKPGYNYEAGGLAFGPDGYLYIATGDSVRDPASEAGKYAQDLFSPLGKILRIDVDGTAPYQIPPDNPFADGRNGLPEIYASGLRNPYRISFDVSEAGQARLFAADVGQARMEEVNRVVPGGNYGWPIREGTSCFNAQDWSQPLEQCPTDGLREPLLAYTHEGELSAVIGGLVYHGSALPDLRGGYVFGDWGRGNGHLFVAYPDAWTMTEIQVQVPADAAGLGQLLGIGQDLAGELYLLVRAPGLGATGETGRIYKVVTAE